MMSNENEHKLLCKKADCGYKKGDSILYPDLESLLNSAYVPNKQTGELQQRKDKHWQIEVNLVLSYRDKY
jgi:hypothetical protein